MSIKQREQQSAIAIPGTRHVDIVSSTPVMMNASSSSSSELPPLTATTTNLLDQKLLGRIYLPPDEVDPLALKQVIAMCTHPACAHVRAMPDCCKGNGCTVGFTCQLTNSISPQLIGGDIACGISAIPISKKVVERRNGLERILNVIHDCVPMGGGAAGVQQSPVICLEQYAPFLEQASLHWRDFNAAYLEKFGVNLDQYATQKYAAFIPPPHEAENINALGNCMTSSTSFIHDNDATTSGDFGSTNKNSGKNTAKFQYTLAWLQKRVQEWGITMEQMKCSMLSLGSGNHFVELNQLTFSLDDHSSAMANPLPLSASLKNNNSNNNNAKNSSPAKNNSNSKKSSGKNTKDKKKHNNNNNDSSDDSDDDSASETSEKHHDDNASDTTSSDDELPEYVISVHTGSRAVGQAVYRFWTKKCAQYQQARTQLQLLQQQQLATGGKLTTEQLVQLAQATATLATTSNAGDSSSSAFSSPTSKNKKQIIIQDEMSTKTTTTTTTATTPPKSKEKPRKKGSHPSKKSLKENNNAGEGVVEKSNNGNNNTKNKEGGNDDDDDDEDETDAQQTTSADAADPSSSTSAFPPPKHDDDESIAFNSGFLLTSHEDLALYYLDVIYAQAFASMNRRAILSTIFYHLGEKAGRFSDKKIIETVHNYIDFKDFVIRKGAVRAHEGERILIGLNMKEGIWLCRGKGNPEWNYSSAHGCGRIKSRSSAAASQSKNSGKGSNKSIGGEGSSSSGSKAMAKKEDPRIKEFKKEMGDVVSKTVNAETFDERPSVYRNSTLVRSLLDPSVDILCRYKTILNCKGGN